MRQARLQLAIGSICANRGRAVAGGRSRAVKPDFFIIDGIVGGEGYGPLRNTPVDSQIVFAGRDPVALDTAAATFMGFTVDEIPHLKLASDEKLGISDLGSIKVVGADLDKIKMKFERAF
jgi:uncharacterized protein (DUF362 family)